MTTPLATVKERFKSKEKLIEALEKLMTDDLWLPRLSSDRGGNKGLQRVSNAKMLRLHDTLSAVKKEFGSRAKLIDAIVEAEKRTKDADYKQRLDAYPVPRLFAQYTASKRRGQAPQPRRKLRSSKKKKK